ncbi:Necrosis-inducing secreted protein 1 [Colletotrichum destructivum]|uniref:Necrosis-inducing secreted protein 1 n=1 Tax=Colletotrichum destructivum TaxID=34406 RepID=A0AAX4IJL8_9PEZI|nr:Necrosis-inducing secreted protein 1 [Colletotrichum destructivum]
MQIRASIAAAAGLFALANARIYGIAFPETVKAGDEVKAVITTENYIQAVQDIAIAFGIATEASAYPKTLGNVLGSFYLGPEESNTLENITETVTIPAGLAPGQYVVAAALYSLYGASSSPTLSHYNVTVTVGNVTSETYVGSQR